MWAFGRLGVAVKFLRMLTPPLLLIVVLSLSLSLSLAEDLVGLRQEIPKRGRYNHSQGGIPDEGVIGSVGEEEDVGIGAIVTKWRENLKRGCYVRSKNDGFIGERGERDQGGASTIAW